MSAREAMIELVGHPPQHGHQHRWLEEVVKLVRGDSPRDVVTYRTARSLWLGEIKKEDHWAARTIKTEAERRKTRRAAEQLALQFEDLAGGLDEGTSMFNSADISSLLNAARILRQMDRA